MLSKVAFEDLTQSKPVLPFPDSVLPALLALRKTHQTVVDSRKYLDKQLAGLEDAKRHLEMGNADVADQQALTKALEKRIGLLQVELARKKDAPANSLAQERLDELHKKKEYYVREVRFLMRTLKKFVDERLGAMLAAEDLGGPVVADMMDIDEDNLVAGFSAQGRPKKAKANVDDDKRQRRIDHMWPVAEGTPEKAHMKQRDEASAAAAEMKQLVEELLNKMFEAEGVAADSYIRISRESSAVRFLIRSKVAQFHPKDATRLRLIDFGRELDD